jgi:hypothetical protein
MIKIKGEEAAANDKKRWPPVSLGEAQTKSQRAESITRGRPQPHHMSSPPSLVTVTTVTVTSSPVAYLAASSE